MYINNNKKQYYYLLDFTILLSKSVGLNTLIFFFKSSGISAPAAAIVLLNISKIKKAGIIDISNPAIGGIVWRNTLRYGSVTVNIGRSIGNCDTNWGNHDNAGNGNGNGNDGNGN